MSGTGTYVNGKKVDQAVLRPSEILQIGETQMRLHVEGADAAPPSEPTKPPTVVLPRERLEEMSGTVLSHFQVGPLLARGQSGLVFRARDYKDELRRVARFTNPSS